MGIRDFLREQVNESPAGGSGGADGGLGPAPTPTPAPPPSSGYVPVTVPPAPPRITREEIGKIADDPRTQRQLERLFRQIGANRDNTDQAVNSAEAANASANEALAQLTRIADALTLLATQPAVTPAITPAGDLAPRGPVHGEPVQAALTNTSGRLMDSAKALEDGAGTAAASISNAPAAGNPTKWVKINDGGTIRLIPAW